MTIEIDVCLSCGASMTRGHHENCPACNGEHMVSQREFEEAKMGDKENEYHFPNNSGDKYTEELRQKICAEAKAERERTAREKQLAEHPVDENGELDMMSPLNNPMLVDSILPKSVLDEKDIEDEEEEIDFTNPENNELIP